MAGGRPSAFMPELLEEICDRLAKGEPLAAICRDDHMPSDRTVRNWMANADVSSAIAHAREVGFDAIAVDALRIADAKLTPEEREQAAADYAETGKIAVSDPQRDRLRVETRLKLLAKWDPKRYGDKLAIGGDEALGPLTVVINKPA